MVGTLRLQRITRPAQETQAVLGHALYSLPIPDLHSPKHEQYEGD
jgi:hypothetical protein